MTDQDREAFEEWRLNNLAGCSRLRSGADHMIVRMEDAWTAALAHARKQTAELVEAVERYNRCPLDAHDRPESWDAIADIQAAAAQFKEK